MRVVLFTGKGGVGKTTTASATALRLADRGCKTLLLSLDPAHSLADALDVPLTGEPAEVAPSLWAVQIDTRLRLQAAWHDVQNYLVDLLARGDVAITAGELTVLPGVEEVLALLAVHELAASGHWDALVVDCAPTAMTLRLLALPEALGRYLHKIFPVQRVVRGIRPFATLLGRGQALPPDTMFEALRNLSDSLAGLRQLLGDRSVTSVRLVLTPETVVTAEARRTFTALALYGYAVDLVVANRVFPAGADGWRQLWARAQQEQLLAIRESFAGLPVRELPYRDREPVGPDALRAVADDLYRPLPGADPGAVLAAPPLVRVSEDGADYLLHVSLPLAPLQDVDAARAGDDLVVTVGPNRRVLSLPSVLRRCTVVAGEFDGAELRVRFRPDPAQWSADVAGPGGTSVLGEAAGAGTPRRRPRPGTAS